MKIKAINNYITAQLVTPEEVKHGSIFLPDPITPRWGTVISVGPGVPDFNGTLIVPDVEVGDLVYIMPHGQRDIPTKERDNSGLCAVSVLDVLCILNNDMKTITPLGGFIEIEPMNVEDTSALIKLPDDAKIPPNIGKVIGIGKGWKDISGNSIPFQVEVGQTVVYDPMRTLIVDMTTLGTNETKHLVAHGDIWGIVEDE